MSDLMSMGRRLQMAVADCQRKDERIAELEAALVPFANLDTEDLADDVRAFRDDSALVMGHFRAARRVLGHASE